MQVRRSERAEGRLAGQRLRHRRGRRAAQPTCTPERQGCRGERVSPPRSVGRLPQWSARWPPWRGLRERTGGEPHGVSGQIGLPCLGEQPESTRSEGRHTPLGQAAELRLRHRQGLHTGRSPPTRPPPFRAETSAPGLAFWNDSLSAGETLSPPTVRVTAGGCHSSLPQAPQQLRLPARSGASRAAQAQEAAAGSDSQPRPPAACHLEHRQLGCP